MRLFSNEIVFRGHPDKVCDQISDALLTAYLQGDENARCGIEVAGGKGKIFITGEVTANCKVNVNSVVKQTLRDIGYCDDYEIINNIGFQSPDIAMGVNGGGAGDQGMMFGYACNQKGWVPLAQNILQLLAVRYDKLVHAYPHIFFPDGKAQITGYYDDRMRLQKIKTFVVSYQNSEMNRDWSDAIIKDWIEVYCEQYNIEIEQILLNPTGRFEIGGFEGDAGLTGRKIVCDSYHSFAPVGGGAFSGKDPTKVDRSAAYKARQLAIRFLQDHNLEWCTVQLSYAIGIDRPMAIYIETDLGRATPPGEWYKECTPNNIIEEFDLKHFDYTQTSSFGHFGLNFPWEIV